MIQNKGFVINSLLILKQTKSSDRIVNIKVLILGGLSLQTADGLFLYKQHTYILMLT